MENLINEFESLLAKHRIIEKKMVLCLNEMKVEVDKESFCDRITSIEGVKIKEFANGR